MIQTGIIRRNTPRERFPELFLGKTETSVEAPFVATSNMSEGAKGGMGDIIQKAIHYQQQLGSNQPKLHLLSKKKAPRITAFRGKIVTATEAAKVVQGRRSF